MNEADHKSARALEVFLQRNPQLLKDCKNVLILQIDNRKILNKTIFKSHHES